MFNPIYAKAIWKARVNSMNDVFVFFGFKKSSDAPTFDMTESHSGFMINNGKLYASVADNDTQQKVEIVGIDCTWVESYMIEYNKFYIKPLPKVQSELGLPVVFSIDRIWKMMTKLTNFPPENEVHYIIQYIKNKTNEEKNIRFNRFIYREVYAD